MLGRPCEETSANSLARKKDDHDLPVVVKRPTPDSQIQDLHDDEGDDHVCGHSLDGEILLPECREAEVHDQKTCLGPPDHQNLAVLNNENELAAERSFVDVCLRHVLDVVSRRQEIRRGALDNVDRGDEDRVETENDTHHILVSFEFCERAESHAP